MQTMPSGQTPVWVWSKGTSFCQAVTPVRIAAGQNWQKSVAWKFNASNAKDGKYKAIATFAATKNSAATIEFAITSVQ